MLRPLLLLLFALASSLLVAQPSDRDYPRGVPFPRPTPAQLDSLLELGIVPRWLDTDPTLYWPRSWLTIAARGTVQSFMTQALRGGVGAEANLAIPFSFTDYGLFLFARANSFEVLDRGWLGWAVGGENRGVLFNGGAGASIAIPLFAAGWLVPGTMSVGAAFFQPEGRAQAAESYLALEPGLGVRYRLSPLFSAAALAHGAFLLPLREGSHGIGSWTFSLGIEMALAPYRNEPVQLWAPALVATATDVVRLLGKEPNDPLSMFDRNLDFINTELKPFTDLGWRYLGFRGVVRGKVIASSRASSGNVTALDIELDSADAKAFRVWRTSMLLDSTLALSYLVGTKKPGDTSLYTAREIVRERIKRGDYAYRGPEDLGVRYLRAELFPEAKGDLELVPKVGAKVTIAGDLWWDGDGFLEIHPRRPSDVNLNEGELLNSDDEAILE